MTLEDQLRRIGFAIPEGATVVSVKASCGSLDMAMQTVEVAWTGGGQEGDGDDPYEQDDGDDTPSVPPTTPMGKALARAYEPEIKARFAETYDWMHSFGEKEIDEINIRLERESKP